MKTPQAIEYLYEWRTDRADGQLPDEWFAHRILKRTKKLVFVEYKIGANHPSRQTMRLDRAKLEANGEIYWSHGTWVICLYTEKGKQAFDARRESYQYIPPCLKALGLKMGATADDVNQAYHKAALKKHPDKGGSHEGFLKLKQDYESALRMVKS